MRRLGRCAKSAFGLWADFSIFFFWNKLERTDLECLELDRPVFGGRRKSGFFCNFYSASRLLDMELDNLERV